jgi:hypothetical protein
MANNGFNGTYWMSLRLWVQWMMSVTTTPAGKNHFYINCRKGRRAMAGMKQTLGVLTVMTALAVAVVGNVPAHASSTVIDGPGFKVENKKGWFGRKTVGYEDALGNKVEKHTGFFGRTSTQTRVFGSEAIKNGNNITVNGPDGKPLVSQKNTLFHGKETHVDGNSILQSFKNLLNP